MADDRRLPIALLDLRSVGRITQWEDIKEYETYHLPPLIYNKRMDIFIWEKTNTLIRYSTGKSTYKQTMFRSDVTARFITKKQFIPHG